MARLTTSAPKVFALPIWICLIRPNARPEGLSSNKDSSGLGRVLRLTGKNIAFGVFQPLNRQLLFELLESVIANRFFAVPVLQGYSNIPFRSIAWWLNYAEFYRWSSYVRF